MFREIFVIVIFVAGVFVGMIIFDLIYDMTRQGIEYKLGEAYCQDLYNVSYVGIGTNCTHCNISFIVCENKKTRQLDLLRGVG